MSSTPHPRRFLGFLSLTLLLSACPPPIEEESVSDDQDRDGYSLEVDCDDTNAAIFPGGLERCDGLDNDCDGDTDEDVRRSYFEDLDGDFFGNSAQVVRACAPPTGYATNSTDCADQDPDIHPGALEICNGRDDNCDDQVDEGFDQDEDGVSVCLDDCDDSNPLVYPGAAESCNGIDDNCDGQLGDALVDEDDPDYDGSPNCEDCGPNDSSTRPGGYEICDGIDNDCNGVIDETTSGTWCPDLDGDGNGDASQIIYVCDTAPPEGYVQICSDCNDQDPQVSSSQPETCNGKDDDCDGVIPDAEFTDADLDGTVACEDCNDSDPAVHPGLVDLCDDGLDNDCDGSVGEDEPSDSQVDSEPNDTLETAFFLGTLDDASGLSTCTQKPGQLLGADDVDVWSFESVDQLTDDWSISATVWVPPGVRYCVSLVRTDPEEPLDEACTMGPGSTSAEVTIVPYNATGTFYVRVWADKVGTTANSCQPYTLTACGY